MHQDHTWAREIDCISLTTRRARIRSQQQGISGQLLELLLDHGKVRHVGHGATIISVRLDARERLRRSP